MPNWCSNELEVAGPKDAIKEFRDKVVPVAQGQADADTPISILSTILPLPEGTTEMRGEYSVFTETGYMTALELWGTKWGDCETQLWVDEDTFLRFGFDSAWGPPGNGILNISKMFPELTFTMRYNETGNCFRGEFKMKNGEILEDHADDDFQLIPEIYKEMGVTDDDVESLHEMFWELYQDYVYDFNVTSSEFTKIVVEQWREDRAHFEKMKEVKK